MPPPFTATALAALWLTATAAAAAPALPLPPGAEETRRLARPHDSYALPVGAWDSGRIPFLTLTGPVTRIAWRLPGGNGDTAALAESLRAALVADGYAAIFACATDACGGFDFRYGTDFLAEPEMHIDLSDFRYLSAVRGKGAGADYVGLMVSHAGETGFVELTHIGAASAVPPPPPVTPAPEPAPAPLPDLAADPAPTDPGTDLETALETALETEGHVVLSDLSFASGSADLADAPAPSLDALAAYLAAHPDALVIIVGHTDASGGLGANIALSRQRALSVVARLKGSHGVSAGQLQAEGAGPLAPMVSNLTEAGRQKNRRVEAVLASTR